MFNETDKLPPQLLDAQAEDLHNILGKPTLIHLKGEIDQPLFISTLLHGDETTGYYAIQKLLNHFQCKLLPRSLSILIGNVKAAASGQRRLNTQADYNRVWPGSDHEPCPELAMMQDITTIMHERSPIASIDIHNNTGRNPHYACINNLDSIFISFASMFSNTIVYFTTPHGVQSSAFCDFCPAIVLECGQPGQADGVTHSLRFLEAVLSLQELPNKLSSDINLFHTIARVTIPDVFSFGTSDDVEIRLSHDIETMNFRDLDPGTCFATTEASGHAHFMVHSDENRDVTDYYFEKRNDRIVLKHSAIPSMYTTNAMAIQQDCLCYFMERVSPPV